MSTTSVQPTSRRLARIAALGLAVAALGVSAAPTSASADGRDEPAGVVSVMVLPNTIVSAPAPTSAAMMPGPQSCGTSDCVGDFVDACAAAGGVATETKVVMGPPDGLEVVCIQNASMPR